MAIKKYNHLLPRMIIKRWKECEGKIYNKNTEKTINVSKNNYAKKYYYSLGKKDDKLENRIANFESYVGNLLKKINKIESKCIEFSIKDMEILKLYVVLQSCRNDNTSPVILDDESGFYRNNDYLFGIPLIKTQEEAIEWTSIICDEFDGLKKLTDNEIIDQYKNGFLYKEKLPLNTIGQHLVIVNNNSNAFIVSEVTSIIECSIDNNYMLTYVPVSPKIGLILANSKYFFNSENIQNEKIKKCDEYLSMEIEDEKLVFNGDIFKSAIKINFVKLNEHEINCLNSIIFEDGNKILFSNEDFLNKAKERNKSRHISLY